MTQPIFTHIAILVAQSNTTLISVKEIMAKLILSTLLRSLAKIDTAFSKAQIVAIIVMLTKLMEYNAASLNLKVDYSHGKPLVTH